MNAPLYDLVTQYQTAAGEAEVILARAISAAEALQFSPEAETLRTTVANLKKDRFSVLIFGRFRCGKSTLLNSLIGPIPALSKSLPNGSGPLPTGINPCTARPTRIYHASEPKISVLMRDGTRENWSYERYFAESRQRPTQEENAAFFEKILCFEVGLPVPLCEGGIDIYDVPGMDDRPELDLEAITLSEGADAVVLVLSHPGTMSSCEKQYLDDLKGKGLASYLTVVNAHDPQPDKGILALPPSEETKASIWDRVVHAGQNGPAYSGQDLCSADIYFLNAFQAQRGRFEGDEAAVEASGLPKFERKLGRYLANEPRKLHLRRHLGVAQLKLSDLAREVARQRAALEVDQQTFDDRLASLGSKLAAIPRETSHIPALIRHHRNEAVQALLHSLKELFRDIVRDLPAYMERQQLPSLNGPGVFKRLTAIAEVSSGLRRKVCEEAMGLAQGYVQSRIDLWRTASPETPGAAHVLAASLEPLLRELDAESAKIDQKYLSIQEGLARWPKPTSDLKIQDTPLSERVGAAVVGALTGQFWAVTGAVHGWRGLFTGAVVYIAIKWPLIILLNIGAPYAGVVAMVSTLAWNIFNGVPQIENEVKRRVVDAVVHGAGPATRGLLQEPDRLRPIIASMMDARFAAVEVAAMKEINARIHAEEMSIRRQQAEVAKSAAGRAESRQRLEIHEAILTRCLDKLQRLLNEIG